MNFDFPQYDADCYIGLHVCVSGVRPQSEVRSDDSVGEGRLVEFVAHHLAMGVDHMFIGFQLDWQAHYIFSNTHTYIHTYI